MNYGNLGICRSTDHFIAVLHLFSREAGYHHREAAIFSLLQHQWGWLSLSRTGQLWGSVSSNHVQAWSRELVLSVQTVPASCRLVLL